MGCAIVFDNSYTWVDPPFVETQNAQVVAVEADLRKQTATPALGFAFVGKMLERLQVAEVIQVIAIFVRRNAEVLIRQVTGFQSCLPQMIPSV